MGRLSLVRRGRIPLRWQLFFPNAAVLIIAIGLLMISPATISSPPTSGEVAGAIAGLLALLAVNLWIINRTVAPLRGLTEVMREVDPLRPGQRVAMHSSALELVVLSEVFNRMLERLETERRESGQRMLGAQERERRRVARELHDEIGQTVTGLMLEISHVAARAPAPVANELQVVQEEARALSVELQNIVRQLRPDALDDLGLGSALTHLSQAFTDRFGVRVVRDLAANLPDLDPAAELVIYRVAQESLTNAGRHSGASLVTLSLQPRDGRLRLTVEDNGIGMNGAPPGSGIRGMRERALLLEADLRVESRQGTGTTIRLELPVRGAR
jgi:two-component system sensor histidine kinase UhpB